MILRSLIYNDLLVVRYTKNGEHLTIPCERCYLEVPCERRYLEVQVEVDIRINHAVFSGKLEYLRVK